MAEFNPSPGDSLTIGRDTFKVAPHPSVPSFAFGQEGRKAFVFQLAHAKRRKLYALKKFKLAFRFAELSDICLALAQYAHLPGMGVCQRECLSGPGYKNVLREFPDLEYAVLMPWMNGSTWYDLVVGKTALDADSSLQMAWQTSLVLAGLEEAGIAHCDIAGPNVIIEMDAGRVHLVDVEDMFAPGMPRPGAMPAGTEGYNHLTAGAGQWGPHADRFAGAVLLAEMLGWHAPAVRDQSDEEHYFAPSEMQQDSDAYCLLAETLRDTAPALADLFERAWFAPAFDDCPPLAEWARLLDPLARPSPVAEWVPLTAVPAPAAPHPGTWDPPPPAPQASPPVIDVPVQAAPSVAPADPPPARTVTPPTPAPGGPLIGFRPLDLSGLAGSHPAANGGSGPIAPPPAPEKSAPARPIEAPPPLEATPAREARPVEAPARPDEAAGAEPDAPADDTAPHPVVRAAPDRDGEEASDAGSPPAGLLERLFLRRQRGPRAAADESPPPDAQPAPDGPTQAVEAAAEGASGEQPGDLVIAPPAPPTLRIGPPGADGGYRLTWEAVPEATHYVLQESTRMAFADGKQATVRGATGWHVNRRPPGTYYYRVRAHSDDDYSAWSNIVFARFAPRQAADDAGAETN